MKINEVEAAVGVTKKNIRFYEEEGLILSLIHISCVYGGANMEKQAKRLAEGCQIVVATPGRLMDHYKHHSIEDVYKRQDLSPHRQLRHEPR